MRLLRCWQTNSDGTIEISLEEPCPIPPYAILSHRWRDEEVSFSDMSSGHARQKKGYTKVMNCCRHAARDGYYYVWIDTCCIDKSSSAELSEAINSMYAWYRDAKICYAYLDDVESDEDPRNSQSSFSASEWFKRGWTLQELIAPMSVIFLAEDWTEIGSKASLANIVEGITRIERAALLRTSGYQASVAKRMSWAAPRTTSREEDRAYSLLGLFGINMPTLYGEGSRAFARLQEEIIKVSNDHTIFAWVRDFGSTNYGHGLLARSPMHFTGSHDVEPFTYKEFDSKFEISAKASERKLSTRPDYALTNFGVRIQLPLHKISDDFHLAYLACKRGRGSEWLRILLKPKSDKPAGHYARIPGRLEFVVVANLKFITIEDIYVTDVDRIFATPTLLADAPQLFVVTMTQPIPARFKPVDCYPPDPSSHPVQGPIRITAADGEHRVLSFQDPLTQERFSAVLGNFDHRMWSDIAIQNETAETIHRNYNDFTHVGKSRYERHDWIKTALLGNNSSVLMTVRERDDRAFAVRITVVRVEGAGSITFESRNSRPRPRPRPLPPPPPRLQLPPPKSLREQRDRKARMKRS